MKRRIAIFQTDLSLGGIQRSLINLLNNIDMSECEVDLYLFSQDNFYTENFPKGLNIVYIKRPSGLVRFIPFWFYYLCKQVNLNKQYDLSIDFNGYQNFTATYALKTSATQHIYWVHSDLYIRRNVRQKNLLMFLYSRLLLSRNKWRRFDKFVGVSDGVLEGFRFDFPEKDFVVIPNLIDADDIIEKASETVDDLDLSQEILNLVIVGRLEYAKGIDLLLPKIADVVNERKAIHFYIIGDGSERAALEHQVRQLGIVEYVTFLGAKKNPYKYLGKMDGLVLNSRYEGQGMVLLEAKALGIPSYFPSHLEKYNLDLIGVEDISQSLISAQKISSHIFDYLKDYNDSIVKSISLLLMGK